MILSFISESLSLQLSLSLLFFPLNSEFDFDLLSSELTLELDDEALLSEFSLAIKLIFTTGTDSTLFRGRDEIPFDSTVVHSSELS